ncbi:MmcQ/YjbR family DNA-binding protein [Nonomuraea ceibae]|uniref:MmcQ/YjbR family DNA-binding protein n=1 Tax=Nonomuraea ceibae TaxID=1935170 RepID=UPI001C607AF2|nr:MmcQ/YjbR family DNA-binding protein [Nonomuraea ceibae]
MIGIEDIRQCAMVLPEVEEATHFRLPSFKVAGKPFAGVEKGETTAIVSVTQADAQTAVTEEPEIYEEVWRAGGPHGRIFVGLRVVLAKVTAERMRELVVLAWRNKALKRLMIASDEVSEFSRLSGADA